MAHILVADDDLLLSDILRFRMESEGHRVTSASNGQQALDFANNDCPDIIILDSMMPVLSGQEVLQQLKATEVLRDIPVIMLTARSGEHDIVNALQSGVNDYMTKPFLPDELAMRVQKLLS